MQKEILNSQSQLWTQWEEDNFDDYTGNYIWTMLLFQSLMGLTLTALLEFIVLL